jgi:hypothetical protein
MDPDDASSAEMRRRHDPHADPLALDEQTAERLLAGDLPPDQAPPGYERVAALLAATTAEPTPDELAGQSEVLAELRAVTRARRAGAHTRRAVRSPRRRWAGLAAVALVGALVTGGAAAAAGGHLPVPVRDAARSILGTVGGGPEPATPTSPDPQPAPATSSPAAAGTTAGPKGPRPASSTVPRSAATSAGPAAQPDKDKLCKAFLASQDKEHGKQMDATAFQRLAEAAGGESQIPAYCEGVQPKDEKGKPEPGDQGQGQGQGQGGQPATTGAGGQGASNTSNRSPSR